MRPAIDTRLPIGEVAAQAGIPTSTIRYYEKQGVLPPAQRVNGQRRYNSDVTVALAVIDLAKQVGFSLEEIKTLLYGFSDDTSPHERWKALALNKLSELDQRMEQLAAMKLLLQEGIEVLVQEGIDCKCLRLDDCAVVLTHLGMVQFPVPLIDGPTASQATTAPTA